MVEKKVTPPEEKKVESASEKLDKVIETGEKPENLEALLKDSATEINKKIEEEKVEKEKTEKEKKPPKPESKDEDELIPEEERKKYGIPDNIKTRKAAYEWGPNAEKKMRELMSEKDKAAHLSSEAEKRIAGMEETMQQFKKALKLDVQEGEISEEERLVEQEKMRILWERDPIAAVNKVVEDREKKAADKALEAQRKSAQDNLAKSLHERRLMQANELVEAEKKYGDKWKDVFPAITKICAERPHLVHFEEAEYFYLKQIKEQEDKIAAEEEAKRKEKIGAGSETSHHSAEETGGGDADLLKAIENASSQEELEKLTRSIKK